MHYGNFDCTPTIIPKLAQLFFHGYVVKYYSFSYVLLHRDNRNWMSNTGANQAIPCHDLQYDQGNNEIDLNHRIGTI